MDCTVYLPSGLLRHNNYKNALKVVKEKTHATTVKRWKDRSRVVDDFYKDGTIVAQIEADDAEISEASIVKLLNT